MRTRNEFEELENNILAPYAMKSKDSAGRQYDNSPHEFRTCYERDRDRIVHCEAFRKLEYKTQVFVILEGDYYRTRLTHTIEVAQIARTIGRSLRLNEDLIEAIALAHDLGHPPFGHAGEEALSHIMNMAGCGQFNHNFRSYEIVTKFEKRYPRFIGLDLSREVIVGILKHETAYDIASGVEEYKNDGPTLEAKVVDIADALAYLSHDVDDGLTSGLITEEDLQESRLWQKAYDVVKDQVAANDREMFKYQIVKSLIDMQTKDLLKCATQVLEEKNFQSAQDVQQWHLQQEKRKVVERDQLIRFSDEMQAERKALQALLMERLYRHFRVERMTEKAKRVIGQIFEVYKNNPNQLPYDFWSQERKPQRWESESEKEYIRKTKEWDKKYKEKQYQSICNYIASMTDRFALDEHKKLFEPFQKV